MSYIQNNHRNEMIENNFTYHAPQPGQPEKYQEIREKAKELAYLITRSVPPSRECAVAITKLEEAVFWANAGIARNPVTPQQTPQPVNPRSPQDANFMDSKEFEKQKARIENFSKLKAEHDFSAAALSIATSLKNEVAENQVNKKKEITITGIGIDFSGNGEIEFENLNIPALQFLDALILVMTSEHNSLKEKINSI